jgi:Trk K+ transport system NAD-binding subunit
MDKWQRRTVYYFVVMTVLMFAYALVYQWGMVNLEGAEGTSATFVHAVQVVVETFTTTGFGSDSPWETTFMNVLVIVMDTTGTLAIFLALPVILFPALEDAFKTTVPTTADEDLSDHVVISTHSQRVDALITELDAAGIEYVIVEPDRETALDLYEDGYRTIHGDLRSASGLRSARLPEARALVTDVSDQVDVRIVLTARELDEEVQIVSVVGDPDQATYHELAGADVVLSPRQVVGKSLAKKVTATVSMDLGEDIEVGEDFEIVEIPVSRGSDLVGTTIGESGLRERTGVNVIGVWSYGEFKSPPAPDTTIDAGTVLLVSGQQPQIDEIRRLTRTDVRKFTRKDTVVVGYGEVGKTIVSRLEEAGIETTVVDIEEKPGVDVVGDATDADTLRTAGVETVEYVAIVLPDDATAELSALVVRDLNQSAEVIARVQELESVEPMYRGGADYVLSLGTVTGRMIASAVTDTDDIIVVDSEVEAIQTPAPNLVGQTLAEARVQSKTGCTVIAVVRDEEVLTDVGPDFRVQEHDELIVVCPGERVDQFHSRFGPN